MHSVHQGIITFCCHHLWHFLLLRLWKHCTGHTGARPSMSEGEVKVWCWKNIMATTQTEQSQCKHSLHSTKRVGGRECQQGALFFCCVHAKRVFHKVRWHAVVTWVWRARVFRFRQWSGRQRWAPSGGGGTWERVWLWWAYLSHPECLHSSAGRTRPLAAPRTQQMSCWRYTAPHQQRASQKAVLVKAKRIETDNLTKNSY